jgi:hypothetical protein
VGARGPKPDPTRAGRGNRRLLGVRPEVYELLEAAAATAGRSVPAFAEGVILSGLHARGLPCLPTLTLPASTDTACRSCGDANGGPFGVGPDGRWLCEPCMELEAQVKHAQ